MSVFVSPGLLKLKIAEYDSEAPQICFPVKFITQCIITYSLILFLAFFAFYNLFILVAVAVGTLAILYTLLLGKLFSVLRLSVWKYVVFNILWWIAIWFLASFARIALISLLMLML